MQKSERRDTVGYTGVEQQDNFSNVLYGIINSVNLAISSMYDLQQAMTVNVDTSSLQSAMDEINQAAMAMNEMQASIVSQVSVSPVEIPVTWQSSNMDVFSGTGAERYKQEIQSTKLMLDQLSNTQDKIARQAYNTEIFPPSAARDLNSMAVRIDMVKNRIQQMESNPMSIGTDAANVELEQMRSGLSRAIQEQNVLNAAVGNMDVTAANQAYLRLSQTVGNTERYIRDNVDAQGQFTQVLSNGISHADGLANMIKKVSSFLNIQNISSAFNISDELTQATARLDLMNDKAQTTQELVHMVHAAAQDARGSFGSMADVVANYGNSAGNAFGSSAEIVEFASLIQKEMTMAGASTQEAASAQSELAQALGSGALSGDELNSIFGQSPGLIQNIADYMHVPVEQLMEMGQEGGLTADTIKNAIFASADNINTKFDSMPMTWGQAWQSMQNDALMAFQPVLQRLGEIANSPEFSAFVDSVGSGMAIVADTVMNLFDVMGAAGSYIADNWSWISPIIYGLIAALTVYLAIAAAVAVINGVIAFSEAKKAAAEMMATGTTFALTAVQHGYNASLAACPVAWIVLAIIAFIAVLFAVCNAIATATGAAESGFGIICGAVAAAVAFVVNTIIGLLNGVIQLGWTMFVEPWIGIIEWVLNVFGGGFDSFGDGVANLIGEIISWFLSMGKVVTKIIDAIFGTEWTSELSSLQDEVLSWGKNDEAITLDRNAKQIDYRMGYEEAFKSGANWGDDIAEKVSGWFESDKKKEEKEKKKEKEEKEEIYVPPYSPSSGWEDVAPGVNETAQNTEKMADSMEITSEDLKYLRDIAEREIINRFTTAEISVSMTNHNNVSSKMDLDGITEHLRSTVEEQLYATAEGVH